MPKLSDSASAAGFAALATLYATSILDASKRYGRARLARYILALPLLLSISSLVASAAAVPRVEFEKVTLANGLQVILHIDRKLPVVHVSQWFHVGSKNERAGRTGFAHLFEHMMFQGSKNAPEDYFSYVSKAGANLFAGGVNGTTELDRTNYFATVPSGSLEYLLWLESDRLATLADALTQEKLDNQRDVVKNERRQSFENQPYGRAFKLILENLFPQGHPYSWFVIGSHEDLTAASLEDVREFFRTYYTPNNLSLVIAGDFDKEQAKRWVEKYFGGIPPGAPLDRMERWVPGLSGEKVVEATDRVAQERVYIAWPAPPHFEAGEAELQLASGILTDGLSSRLKKALVYDRQLASDVSSFQQAGEISGLFVVVATARPGTQLSEVEQAVTDEIARLSAAGPTPAELERVKAKVEYTFVSALEDIGGFAGKAERLNMYNTYLGDPGRFEADLARYRDASATGVRDAVNRWLNTRKRLLVRFHPEASGRASAVTLDRSHVPQLGADKPFLAPEVQSRELANGLEVFVVKRTEVPKVVVTLATHAGAVADPVDRAGLATMTVATLNLGTRTRKALEIENALGDLGAEIDGSAQTEFSSLSLQVLRRNLSPAIAILADVVRNPVFPEAEIAREKQLQLDRLAQQANSANALADRLGKMLLFGRDHPYGRAPSGLPATVQAITRTDLARFHAEHWRPAGSALIFAGDITLDAAIQLAQEHFGSWSGAAPPGVAIPDAQPLNPGGVFVVDRQDAAQTLVVQVLPGPARDAADYYAFNLVNTVWGGGFRSRLLLNLREDKGYSYGVFAFPAFYTEGGAWVASGGVQTDKTKESIVEFNAELANIAGRKPISQAELTEAKENRVRGYAQEFRSLGQVAGQIARVWVYGLPMSEMQRYPQETEHVTLESVNMAAQKYAVPGKATLLLIGDYRKLAPGLRELNLGKITLLDTLGNSVAEQP